MNKNMRLSIIPAIAAALILLAPQAVADNRYEITWSTIDTGGTTSTAGPYELVGTIGQHDTDISDGSVYTLNSGFWPGNFGCVVNLVDLLVIAEFWLEARPNLPADIDQSGSVDMQDFVRLSYLWYDLCPADWQLK